MDKDVLLWIIGAFLTFIVAPVVGWTLTRVFLHGDRLVKIETDIGWIRESFNTMGKKAVRVLHSPHTPNLDVLLEKYEAETISWTEVNELHEMLEAIVSDPNSGKDMKTAAGILIASLAIRYKREEMVFR